MSPSAISSTLDRLRTARRRGDVIAAGAVPFALVGLVLAIGVGLIAYAGAGREPGPAYIGVLVLLAFVEMVGVSLSGGGSFLGWPPTIPLREDEEA
jgi:hypothetical protein